MRIGLRVFYNQAWLGGVNYVLNIARMLRALPVAERPFVCFLTSTPAAEEIATRHQGLVDMLAPVEDARELDLDFAYPATQLAESVMGAPWAGWIPDWQCRHYPELFPEEERVRRFLQYRSLAQGPSMCVFSSCQALNDTKAMMEKPNDSHWRIFRFPAVFPEDAWSRDEARIAQTVEKFGAPKRYYLICNQFWRHKNHLAVLNALADAPDLDVHVVMTGAMEDGRWPDYANSVQEVLKRPEVARRVTITGRIDREDQIDLMIGATAFIQPSLFEGWSTFVEEARALGLPGVLSDIPVHREQSPCGAVFFDPHNVSDLVEILRRFNGLAPSKLTLGEARRRHEAYVIDCARCFVDIAKEAKVNFKPQLHEAVSVIAHAAECVAEQNGGDGGIEQSDYDRFCAGIRHLFRTHPDDLARLSGVFSRLDSRHAKEFETLLVKATLAKMSPELRERFHSYDPTGLGDFEAQSAAAVQAQVGSIAARTKTAMTGFTERALNYMRRKAGL